MPTVFDANTNKVLYGDPTERLVTASTNLSNSGNPRTVYAAQGAHDEWFHVEDKWVSRWRDNGNTVIQVYVR